MLTILIALVVLLLLMVEAIRDEWALGCLVAGVCIVALVIYSIGYVNSFGGIEAVMELLRGRGV